MNSKNKTLLKLLPRLSSNDSDREDALLRSSRSLQVYNVALALVISALLAFILLPRTPHLEKGDMAPRSITAPYTLYVEYQGPDQTALSFKVNKGELIIEAGQRVTERTARIIEEMARREGVGNRVHAFLGLVLLVMMFFYLVYRDIKRYRPALLEDRSKTLLLSLLLLITISISQVAKYIYSLLADRMQMDPVTIGFALPVAAGAMLTSLLLDFHLALGFSFVVSILLGILFQGDPFIPIYYFLGSIVSALSVIQCKKRTALLRAGALTALINSIVIVGIDLYHGDLMTRGIYDLTVGAFGALSVSMLVSASLPFFESAFDIATDIKLLELLEPNQPLLKELVYKSPGTYHHSIVIGNLAEAAAEVIGENPLLARVGAYYHDIGKVNKPEYYIENQRPSENKHDRLMPSMSGLIIASHVKDGVEAARAHKLPSVVVDIIQQHHGTSLVFFFYKRALQQLEDARAGGKIMKMREEDIPEVSEENFRYGGPKPQTRESAIISLADMVESASRSLEKPTPAKIEQLVNDLIDQRLADHQLDECDLTLRDLKKIAERFRFTLMNMLHTRIAYPKEGKAAERDDEVRPDVMAATKRPASAPPVSAA